MDGYTTLHQMLESALKQAGEESGMLLGQELAITLADSLATSKSSYFGTLDDACFAIGVESREAYTGQFFLLFSLRDAIVLSSILLGIPPARIQEKKRLSIMENDDVDAFSEIANMINGSFNTVFQGTLANKVHLKLLSPKKYIPEVDELSENEPLPEGEYLMMRAKLEMPGQELNFLDILIPFDLANQFDPPAEQPEAVTEPETAAQQDQGSTLSTAVEPQEAAGLTGEVTAAATTTECGPESIIVLDDDENERQQLIEYLAFTGYEIVEGTLHADIKELYSQRSIRLVVIGANDADDRELSICIKVNAIRQDSSPPIVMSAHSWTRTAVLKALKYGAREIIVKPYTLDELTSKVRRLCKL